MTLHAFIGLSFGGSACAPSDLLVVEVVDPSARAYPAGASDSMPASAPVDMHVVYSLSRKDPDRRGWLDVETDEWISGVDVILEQSTFDGECYEHTTARIPSSGGRGAPFLRVQPVRWDHFEDFPRFHDRVRDGVNGGLPEIAELTVSNVLMSVRFVTVGCPRTRSGSRELTSFAVPFEGSHCAKVQRIAHDVCERVMRPASACAAVLAGGMRCDAP